ncbi:head GIN domain-containing protein [Sphingobium sp.]|uniref:head GIN domain-containing protein n=1 Tax=Sphingobium sp. TaxID=1912891 RepID=UPI003B3A69DB
MSRPLPFVALMLAGMALSTTACSRTKETPAADEIAQQVQDWNKTGQFDAIESTGPDNVVVTIGDRISIKADGDPKAVADLDIRTKGQTLIISRKSSSGSWIDHDKGATVRITMPAIRSAQLTGAGDFDLDRAEGDSLTLSLTGAGDFRIGMVKVKSLTTDITGAGSMKIAGAADSAKFSITGAGDIDAGALKVGGADVSVLGAGDIAFASDGKVAISIMGPGDVTVKGKAQCTTSGMGPGEARCAP